MTADRRVVPCGLCRQCCYHEHVFLHPELGDDVDAYRTVEIQDPTGRTRLALKKRPDGGCVYLGVNGCTIHERAPATCRRFDCKVLYERMAKIMSPADLQRFLRHSPPLQVGERRSSGIRP